uniref:Uncharacterized protein n=1 Tax=Trichinella nativa TaxID=6335 RepID=A0A0V1K920_9BILA
MGGRDSYSLGIYLVHEHEVFKVSLGKTQTLL